MQRYDQITLVIWLSNDHLRWVQINIQMNLLICVLDSVWLNFRFEVWIQKVLEEQKQGHKVFVRIIADREAQERWAAPLNQWPKSQKQKNKIVPERRAELWLALG